MRPLFIGIFLSTVLLIITSSHLAVYHSLNIFFPNLFENISRKLFLTIVFLMSFGFIFASVSVHWYENMFTRAFYLGSGSWLGIFSNLFWSTVLLLILYYIAKSLSINTFWLKYFASLLYSISLIASVYGFWNVENPVINKMTIEIENLPSSWENKKIAQLSDVHLGVVHREESLQRLIDMINAEKVDLVVLTGDFFDGMDGRLSHLAEPLNSLKSTHGTFYITGNHETYLGTDKTNSVLAREVNVKHLKNSSVNLAGLNLIGIDYPEQGQKIDLVSEVNRLATSGVNILLYHEPRKVPEIAALNKIDLMLSGHTHYGQVWPYNFIAKKVYGQFVYGLNKIGRLSQYTTTGAGTWGPPMRTVKNSEIPIFTLQKQ